MANGSSNTAIADAANAIAGMRNDISAMVGEIRQLNSALSVTSMRASTVSSGTGVGGWGAPAGGQPNVAQGADFGRIALSFVTGGPVAGLVTAGKEIIGKTLEATKDVALASYSDLRIGREQAMDMERQRLIARAGTGNFDNFQNSLNIAMNDINVQDRWQLTRDLAGAMSSYYNTAMGGGVAGEQRAAMAVGAMHTLASVAGVDASAVGGATGAMYSSQSYYKAMAAGIQTRNPVTGDMLNPEEIVNQYRKRLSKNTPEQLKRALGPGGTLRAELMQTWGDAGLVEMISKGLVMSAEQGGALRVGDIQSAAIRTGYAGTEWTQGRDTESLKAGAMQNRVAEYTNDVTAGIATSNTILADINAKIANLGADGNAMGEAVRKFVGATETFGGIMDQAMTDMPQTTAYVWESAKTAISDLAGSLMGVVTSVASGNALGLGASLLSAGGPLQVLGSLALGGALVRGLTAGAATGEPTPTDTSGTTGEAPAIAPGGEGGSGPSLSDGTAQVANTINNTKTVTINLTVSNASDAEAVRFAAQVQDILNSDQELTDAGTGNFV